MTQVQSNPGTAYAVFKCTDPRPAPLLLSRFREALENIRLASEETKIPPETGFFVTELAPVLASLRVNGAEAELVGKIEAVERQGANYLLQASLPGSSNAIAARDLGDVINMLYGGTELFDAESSGRELLVADIFFKDERGRYVSKLELESRAP